MSKVKERSFNTKHLPEGDYRAKITKCDDHTSKAGNFQWLYTISITDAKGKGAAYPYYCGVEPDQLWKVRNLFVAAGVNVPKKRLKLDPNKVVGRGVGITLEDDEYEGKPKSVIAAVLPLSEVGDADEDADEDDEEVEEEDEEDEEEEEPAPVKTKKKAKGKKAPAPAEVDDDELEELEIDEL